LFVLGLWIPDQVGDDGFVFVGDDGFVIAGLTGNF
jgi:hypothetical protein